MFRDRKDAAMHLAKALEKYKDTNALVLGIPRGGAETAYYVADYLDAELSLIVSRKLGHPANPEYAVGAIAEDGSIYLNEPGMTDVSKEELDEIIAHQKEEIKRRINILRKGESVPPMAGRIVILVDDGIATGATLYAAIEMCRKAKADKIVVAAPISAHSKKKELEREVDDVVILTTPDFYHAVSQGYESFYNLTDAQALDFMELWQKEHPERKKMEATEK